MTDEEIQEQIERLVAEEHELQRAAEGRDPSEQERARMEEIRL